MTDTEDYGLKMPERLLALSESDPDTRAYLEKLYSQLILDPLTGIYNERFFSEEYDRLLRATVRSDSKQPLSLTLYDVNDFKLVNDRYGHQAGDRALQQLASTMGMGYYRRGLEVFARLHGDEFVALQPEPLDVAVDTAETVRAALNEQRRDGIPVDVSFGVAEWNRGLHEKLLEEANDNHSEVFEAGKALLMKMADDDLYKRKDAIKNGR